MKLHKLNLDYPTSTGNRPENGTLVCQDCLGMWAPELLARAETHVERGTCSMELAERESRQVPYRPENMRVFLNIAPPVPKLPGPETYRPQWFMHWGTG